MNTHVIETAHLFACERSLNVSDKTHNNMIYGETADIHFLSKAPSNLQDTGWRLQICH